MSNHLLNETQTHRIAGVLIGLPISELTPMEREIFDVLSDACVVRADERGEIAWDSVENARKRFGLS